jgi:hypothetical protein
MKNEFLRTSIALGLGLGALTGSLFSQSRTGDPYVDSVLNSTARLMAQSQENLQKMRAAQGAPALTGNATRDSLTMLREQHQAMYRNLENIKRCDAGDRSACQAAERYRAANQRAIGMLNADVASSRIRNSVTRNQYERNWRLTYYEAKYKAWYYDKFRKNEGLKRYWEKQAEAYKPK